MQRLKINKERYKEYKLGMKERFRVLPTMTLVKRICQMENFDEKQIFENSILISYMFCISSKKNLKAFSSIVGFDSPKNKERLSKTLKYRYKVNSIDI